MKSPASFSKQGRVVAEHPLIGVEVGAPSPKFALGTRTRKETLIGIDIHRIKRYDLLFIFLCVQVWINFVPCHVKQYLSLNIL